MGKHPFVFGFPHNCTFQSHISHFFRKESLCAKSSGVQEVLEKESGDDECIERRRVTFFDSLLCLRTNFEGVPEARDLLSGLVS